MILAGVAALFLGLSALAFRTGGRHYLANPLIAFYGIWVGILLLGQLAHFDTELTSAGTRLTALAFASLAVGGFVGLRLARSRQPEAARVDISLSAILWIAAIGLPLFAVCAGWKFAVAWGEVGVPFAHLGEIRAAGLAGELPVPFLVRGFVLFGYLAAVNLGILWALRPSRLILAMSLALGVLFFLNDLSIGARGSLFNGGMLMASAEIVAGAGRPRGVRRVAHAVATVVVAALAATVIFGLRSGTTEDITASAVIYAGAPVPASGRFIEHPWPTQVPGHWSFAGFWQLVNVGAQALSVDLGLTYETVWTQIDGNPFNTGTFLTYFYSDFGVAGVGVMSALTGLAAVWLVVAAARTRRLDLIGGATLALFTLAFTPRGFIWSGMVFWPLAVMLAAQPVALRLLARARLSRRSGGELWHILPVGVSTRAYGRRQLP